MQVLRRGSFTAGTSGQLPGMCRGRMLHLRHLHRLMQKSRTHLRVGVTSTEEGSSIDLSKILQHQSNRMKGGSS